MNPTDTGGAEGEGESAEGAGKVHVSVPDEQEVAVLRTERDGLRRDLEAMAREAEKAKETLEMVKKSLREEQSRHAAELKRCQAAAESAEARKNAVLDPLVAENGALVEVNASLKETLAQVLTRKDELETTVAALTRALAAALAGQAAAEKELDAYRHLCEGMKNSIEGLRSQVLESVTRAFAANGQSAESKRKSLGIDALEQAREHLLPSVQDAQEVYSQRAQASLSQQQQDRQQEGQQGQQSGDGAGDGAPTTATPPAVPSSSGASPSNESEGASETCASGSSGTSTSSNKVQIQKELKKWGQQYVELVRAGLDPFGEPYCFDDKMDSSEILWTDSGNGNSSSSSGTEKTGTGTEETGGEGTGQQVERHEVRAASVNKLVELLTSPTYADADFGPQFLLMYRTFMTPQMLLKKLAVRYQVSSRAVPPDMQVLVRLRVVDTLVKWLESCPADFADRDLQKLLKLFAAGVLMDGARAAALLTLLGMVDELQGPALAASSAARRRGTLRANAEKRCTVRATAGCSSSGAAGEGLALLLGYPLADVARCMAEVDQELFRRITREELMCPQNWAAPEKAAQPAPNVAAMVQRFNLVADWVQSEVLARDDLRERARALQFFVRLAHECHALNNFHAATAITAALHTPALARLHQTLDYLHKKVLSKKERAWLQELSDLADAASNRRALRAAQDAAILPAVPHVGLYLSDLFFIDEGNADYVPAPDGSKTELVNYAKKRLVAGVIQRILWFQSVVYPFASPSTGPTPPSPTTTRGSEHSTPATPAPPLLRMAFENLSTLPQSSFFDLSKRLEPSSVSSSSSTAQTSSSSTSSS